MVRSVTVEAPSNIALIKYWGKRDEDLILPLNDNLSLTIDSIFARTKVTCVEASDADSVSINGKPVNLTTSKRFIRCFNEARRLQKLSSSESGSTDSTNFSFQVESTTNFPVAAGLASSAAGFAAIAFAIGKLLGLDEKQVSALARIGSGSACRSVLPGLVIWFAGTDPSGMDSYAESLFPASHWDDLRAVILVLTEAEKETGSTIGMKRTVETSQLLQHRIKNVVPEWIKMLTTSFEQKDFPTMAEITMRDSNQLHAVCLDTYPPLQYRNSSSWSIIELVHSFNMDRVRAAYTFDAGPNACVFLQKDDVESFLSIVPTLLSIPADVSEAVSNSLDTGFKFPVIQTLVRLPEVKNIIVSKVGGGPRVVQDDS